MLTQKTAQTKSNSIYYLSSLGKKYFKLSTRIAILTFTKPERSQFSSILLISIEYLQLISQTFLFESKAIHNGISPQFITKLVNPAFWLDFNEQKTLSAFLFLLFLALIGFKYLLLAYVTIIARLNIEGYSISLSLWRFVFKVQGRVMCFLSSSLFFQIISSATSQEGLNILGLENTGLFIVSIFAIVLEYALAFLFQMQFYYVLPSKSFLSSKSNSIDMLNLIQKLTTQILLALKTSNLLSIRWIFPILSLSFSIARNNYYFTTLPLYNHKALLYLGTLLMIVTSLDLSLLFESIMDSCSYYLGPGYIFIFWVIISLLSVMAFEGSINWLMISLINNKRGSPEFLIHKISFVRYLKKHENAPSKLSNKSLFLYLLNTTISSRIISVFHLNSSDTSQHTELKIDSKTINHLCLSYIESLLAKFPKNGLIRLYKAYICVHKLKQFGTAMKIISDINQSYSEKFKYNASLLIHDIQEILIKASNNEGDKLDLSKYIKSQIRVASLKVKMLDQARLQRRIYKEILDNLPNLQVIFHYAQIVDHYRSSIEREIKQTLEVVPDNFIEPLKVCACYSYLLNDSSLDYSLYEKSASQKHKKYEKFFRNEKLEEENLFQDTNTFLLTSGQVNEAGKIIYCSKSIEKLYGNSAYFYIGTNISTLTPLSLQAYYASYFKTIAEKGEKSLVRKVSREFGYHADGYMIQADFYIDYYLLMMRDFCFSVILRPVPTTKDYLLVLENGDIECATEKIGKRLGIPVSKNLSSTSLTNISLISKELGLVNQAFNVIALPDKHRLATNQRENQGEDKRKLHTKDNLKLLRNLNKLIAYQTASRKNSENSETQMNIEKARELYSVYNNEGIVLKLKSVDKKSYGLYHCTVRNIFYGSLLVKVVTLEQISGKNHDDPNINNKDLKAPVHNAGAGLKCEIGDTKTPKSKKESHLVGFDLERSKGVEVSKFSHLIGRRKSVQDGQVQISLTTDAQLLSPQNQSSFIKTVLFEESNKTGKSDIVTEQRIEGKKKHEAKSPLERKGATEMSHLSRNPQQRRISSAVKSALETKYYSKFLVVFSVVFCAMLIGLFISQITIKNSLDNSLASLKAGKDIVSNAELRNFLLVTIQQTVRLIWDLGTGRLVTTNMTSFAFKSQSFVFLLNIHLESLAKTNEGLLESMKSLDEETRKFFFAKTIKVYDNYFDDPDQSFNTFDNFQATNLVIETGFKGFSIMMSNITQAKNEIHFLLRNSVNDLLLESEMASDILMESLNTKREDFSKELTYYLIFVILLMAAMTIAFSWAIWRQFKREQANMLAIIRLRKNEIQQILDKTERFERIIKEEIDSKEESDTNSLPNAKPEPCDDEFNRKNRHKGSNKLSKRTGISTKYWLYVISLLLLTIGLVGLIFWFSKTSNNSIKTSQARQNQFFFINRLKSQISLAEGMSQELFSKNGTSLFHNEPLRVEFPNIISELITMKNSISKALMDEDLSYHLQVQDILFNDGCPYINPFFLFYCELLKNNGKKTGLIYILSHMQTLFDEAYQGFQASDRSTQALKVQEAKTLDDLMVPFFISMEQCDAVSSIISKMLENDILSAQKQRNLTFGIFTSLFSILGFLVWISVFKPLLEANNRFKKVLELLPANLIFSSFLLKTFVMETSRGTLNSVKNDI